MGSFLVFCIIHILSLYLNFASTIDCVVTGSMVIDFSNEYEEAFISANAEKCFEKEEKTGRPNCFFDGKYRSLKRDCVCSYHQLRRGLRPEGFCSDDVDDDDSMMTCQYCKNLSNNGPCLKGSLPDVCPDILAKDMHCNCDPGYEGNFCDMKKVAIECHHFPGNDTIHLCNKSDLKVPCVAFGAVGTNLTFLCKNIYSGENQMEECQRKTNVTVRINSSSKSGKQGSTVQSTTVKIAVPSTCVILVIGIVVVISVCAYKRCRYCTNGTAENGPSEHSVPLRPVSTDPGEI